MKVPQNRSNCLVKTKLKRLTKCVKINKHQTIKIKPHFKHKHKHKPKPNPIKILTLLFQTKMIRAHKTKSINKLIKGLVRSSMHHSILQELKIWNPQK